MAASKLIITLISSFLLVALLANAHETIEKKLDIVVEGLVYCQSCENFGSWSLAGAKPIPSAKISVICKDFKNRVNYYKVFETDNNGYFYAQLDGFKVSHSLLEHPLQSCSVKLVSSPLESCNLLSNVNNALYGAPLKYEDKRFDSKYYEAVIYSAGPLAFRPTHCSPH